MEKLKPDHPYNDIILKLIKNYSNDDKAIENKMISAWNVLSSPESDYYMYHFDSFVDYFHEHINN